MVHIMQLAIILSWEIMQQHMVISVQVSATEAEATVNAYKTLKIDTTDDKSIDVYADETPAEETKEEAVEVTEEKAEETQATEEVTEEVAEETPAGENE